MDSIRNRVLARIKPSRAQEEHATHAITHFITQLNKELHKKHLPARALLGGSFAKGTWLANEFDVDIFISFDTPVDDMSAALARALPKNAKRVHGSRDYFQLATDGILYEIIPVLTIRTPDEAKNVTDFSPLHVAWVQRAPALTDDIRLAKQFLKAHRLYGAESYLQGFSGHVVDILTIHYGGFEALLKHASKWKDKTIIDPAKHYKSHALHHLNTSKTQGPLIVIDPLDKTRNAAAAVGTDAFLTFIAAAKQFLKKPREDAFHAHAFDPDKRIESTDILCKITLAPGKRDIRGNKLVKIYDFLKNQLAEFGITASNWEWDAQGPAYAWFTLKHHTLPATLIRKGPPTTMHSAAAQFRAAHTDTHTSKGTLYARVTRAHTTLRAAITTACTAPYVKERCTRIDILKPGT